MLKLLGSPRCMAVGSCQHSTTRPSLANSMHVKDSCIMCSTNGLALLQSLVISIDTVSGCAAPVHEHKPQNHSPHWLIYTTKHASWHVPYGVYPEAQQNWQAYRLTLVHCMPAHQSGLYRDDTHPSAQDKAAVCLPGARPWDWCRGQYAIWTRSKVLGDAARPAVARQNATTLATVRTRFREFHWRRLLLTCMHFKAAVM